MKRIAVYKDTKSKLDGIKEDKESVNDTLTRLFAMVEPSVKQDKVGRTSIAISEENLEMLKMHKEYPTEPYDSIINRLLDKL